MNLTLDLRVIMLFAWVGYSEAKESGRSQCTTDGGSELDHSAKEKFKTVERERESNDCAGCKEVGASEPSNCRDEISQGLVTHSFKD